MIVLIPAREGSKGVPRKNIKELDGKPLIQYTIDAAREVFEDKYIYVSTDSKEIKKIVEKEGLAVPFLRPKIISGDSSNAREVIIHALDFFKSKNNFYPEKILYLQPTSPLRNSKHIKEAISLFNKSLDMVVSVCKSKYNPYFNLYEENTDGFLYKSKDSQATNRQECKDVYCYNGAIYIINVKSIINAPLNNFKKIVKYEMSRQDSVDIDEQLDFDFAEFIIKKNKK